MSYSIVVSTLNTWSKNTGRRWWVWPGTRVAKRLHEVGSRKLWVPGGIIPAHGTPTFSRGGTRTGTWPPCRGRWLRVDEGEISKWGGSNNQGLTLILIHWDQHEAELIQLVLKSGIVEGRLGNFYRASSTDAGRSWKFWIRWRTDDGRARGIDDVNMGFEYLSGRRVRFSGERHVRVFFGSWVLRTHKQGDDDILRQGEKGAKDSQWRRSHDPRSTGPGQSALLWLAKRWIDKGHQLLYGIQTYGR